MSRNELAMLLGDIADTLRINRAFMTDEVLLKLQSLLDLARESADVLRNLTGLTGEQTEKLLEAGAKFVKMEQKLVKTDLSVRLEGILDRLKNRPVILAMIAALM